MEQTPVLDCLCLDLLPFCQNCRAASAVNFGGCQIAEAFVVAVVVEVSAIDPVASMQAVGNAELDAIASEVRDMLIKAVKAA